MNMRGGLIPRPPIPGNRTGLIRPPYPFRGRGVILMNRPRLGPGPPRPVLIRGVPPFVGRRLLPPGRHFPFGPVIMPRPLPPPPGTLRPHLGPRSLLPRPMLLPHGHLRAELTEVSYLVDEVIKSSEDDDCVVIETSSTPKANQTAIDQSTRGSKSNRGGKINQNFVPKTAGSRKNRKDPKNRKEPSYPPRQETPPWHRVPASVPSSVQSSHPSSSLEQNSHPNHLMQQPTPQQNVIGMNQTSIPKQLPPIQTSTNANIQPLSQLPMLQSIREGRNDMNHRNQGSAPIGHVEIHNIPPSVGMNQGHVMHHGAHNIAVRRGAAPIPPVPNVMMNGPPLSQCSGAPPLSNYAAASAPVMTQQMPIKRGAPLVGPPMMQQKRVRYEHLPPANGYVSYQQPPVPQQPVYQSYDVPPPTDLYYNSSAPVNVAPQQPYSTPDYNNYQALPSQPNSSYCPSINTQYSTGYNNQGSYSSYTAASEYDQPVEYNTVLQHQQQPDIDSSGYSKLADSYDYSNTCYTAPQETNYEDYSGGYVDQSEYTSTVQDPSYGQPIGTYPAYSY